MRFLMNILTSIFLGIIFTQTFTVGGGKHPTNTKEFALIEFRFTVEKLINF